MSDNYQNIINMVDIFQASNYLSEQDQLLVAQAEEDMDYIDQLELDESDPTQVLKVS